MILMIDNYDSFTYNLVQYIGEMGEEIVVYRNDEMTVDDILQKNPKAVMISPGPCSPDEAGISLEAAKRLPQHVPVFGVCLGHQSIAQAYGGRVIRASRLMHGKTSPIHHDEKTIFRGIEQDFIATRYHSLIVERESLPACFDISAETAEGEIMAIRHKTLPMEAVQFHPESIMTAAGKQLLQNFLEEYTESRRQPSCTCS
ncbi:aminodeoxychorismate/anthranilate synthase component II [Bacillaceae bacterium SIJ1]|uniref:aminodeoxychorismate/anthranilate synthase component II n=1 Tax=Litoribacterium kuwaitense TaxID=1398745 RepID=UPI0013E9AA2E|nr:aminodeoxychorismate/anthranilate synthase component II [Litoribacterium kuwaitense]NGP45819.1 aminodeoxychorismate/anthranilate synthase component II [Litoribacterium kuwaitense]